MHSGEEHRGAQHHHLCGKLPGRAGADIHLAAGGRRRVDGTSIHHRYGAQPFALPRTVPQARHACCLAQTGTPKRLSLELCVRRSIAPQRHHRAADLLLCQEAGQQKGGLDALLARERRRERRVLTASSDSFSYGRSVVQQGCKSRLLEYAPATLVYVVRGLTRLSRPTLRYPCMHIFSKNSRPSGLINE